MPRPRPPHLHRETTRHGRKVWIVRIGKGPRFRVRGEYGTPEFDTNYQAALQTALTGDKPRQKKGEPSAGSLAWLIARYRETTAWESLSLATRRQRENIFKQVLDAAGHQPVSKVTRAQIIAGKERRKETPFQARHFLDAMRGLFRWALQAQLIKADPTVGVENPPRKSGDGFVPWTEEHVTKYQARWPIGTRQRVWLDVLLYTGLRRGDAARLGRQHVRDGIATIKVEKSSHMAEVNLPILPVLQATLDAGPCGDLTFIAGTNGRPLTKESFGNEFKAACREAGVPGSAHGVRKLAATTMANNGATVAQLEAVFAWTGGTMASLYTRKADRRRLALGAMHLMANDTETSMPAPLHPVRASEEKVK